MEELKKVSKFSENGCMITGESTISAKGRYAEAKIAAAIQEDVVFFCRNSKGKQDVRRLADAINKSAEKFGYTDIIFMDGGGDSLILRPTDAPEQGYDPFKGGDAALLHALHTIKHSHCRFIHAIVAVGLDIDPMAFQNNIDMLKERDGYFGRVNLKTGEQEDFKLKDLFQFQDLKFLGKYFEISEKILVLNDADLKDRSKTKSHTATVTYHALQGHYGVQRTYVEWEGKVDGVPGVHVLESHAWVYFIDPIVAEQLKLDLNKK
eukprot:TRINITY_DN11128_c0_g1_i2.p1 TRINITY_DN11128_c0_g1~~TRINITY_DN11128_c0_g1_i2.p1  ORF type:complete len:264 (-),score=89.11 TRINITY_DN11128_c0_g1_i2:24-815(-)